MQRKVTGPNLEMSQNCSRLMPKLGGTLSRRQSYRFPARHFSRRGQVGGVRHGRIDDPLEHARPSLQQKAASDPAVALSTDRETS